MIQYHGNLYWSVFGFQVAVATGCFSVMGGQRLVPTILASTIFLINCVDLSEDGFNSFLFLL